MKAYEIHLARVREYAEARKKQGRQVRELHGDTRPDEQGASWRYAT